MTWIRWACLLCFAALLCPLFGSTQEKNSSLAIKGGTVLDGTGAAPRANVTILIKNGKIEAIGTDVKLPADAKTIDATGKFIIPALFDSRVHIGPTPGNHVSRDEISAEQRLQNLRALVAAGVSTVRLIQGDLQEQQVYQRWWTEDVISSPRILTSGPIFTAKWGHPVEEYSAQAGPSREREVRQIAGKDQVRDQVRDITHARANSLEIDVDPGPISATKPRLEKSLLEIIVAEGHGFDLPVFCEVGGNQDVLDAVASGANAVEGVWEESFSDEAIAALVKGKLVFVPALTQQGDLLNLLDETRLKAYLNQPVVQKSLSSTMQESLASNSGIIERVRKGLAGPGSESTRQQLEDQQKRAFANVQKAHAAGVKIAVGTGAGNLLIFPGASVHREMQLLVKAGLTPMEAIIAATRNTAESLGLSGGLGTLEPGMEADLLILDADPLLDIQNTQKIHTVVQRGSEIPSDQLQLH